MGDGRYYSPEQFVNVLMYTILLIFLLVNIMIGMYKLKNNKSYLYSSELLLFISLFCSFIYEVIYGERLVRYFFVASYISIVLYILVLIVFYIRCERERIISKSEIFFIATFFLVPSIILLIEELNFVVYLLYIVNSIYLLNKFAKYSVSSSIFNNIQNLVLEYVYIINEKGDVIYESDRLKKSSFFKKNGKIDINDIKSIFTDTIVIRDAFGKHLIKLEGDKTEYFQYNMKRIYNKKSLEGYILTFNNITEFISMLDELSSKQEETAKVNKELNKYKEIVFDIEKEKEINNLLSEIANNQEKAMVELKEKIENIDYNEDFVSQVELLIEIAKKDLKNVRNAVNAYINYYE